MLKSQLQDMTTMYEACSQEIHAHRCRQEELAGHVEDLVEEIQHERKARVRAESNLEVLKKGHEAELRRERRALEEKESALQSVSNDLARTQMLLTQRDTDLNAVQSSLQTLEAESKRAGETHTTARFSLQLEVDRLKRDLERLEDDLARSRQEVGDRESRNREKDDTIDQLHTQNQALASQLGEQTQARLNVTDKLDIVQGNLRSAESELASFRTRVGDLEQRLSKDQRSLLAAENQYRDQLTERNTLLLTIYQYMDKILGVDKTPVSPALFGFRPLTYRSAQKKAGQAETKPFTNFAVFHDNLITRLKALSQIQLDFDKRCKDIENQFLEKLSDMRKQLDNRWKQIDKFESSVKTYADAKATWRRKFSIKEGELEAIKVCHSQLTPATE
jgi:chromosome segregation ATPase